LTLILIVRCMFSSPPSDLDPVRLEVDLDIASPLQTVWLTDPLARVWTGWHGEASRGVKRLVKPVSRDWPLVAGTSVAGY